MGGLLIVLVVIGIYFFLRAGPDASTFAPLAALAGVGAARRVRRLPQRQDGGGDPRPPEAHLADGRGLRGRLADPADVRHHGDRRAVRRARSRSTRGSTSRSPRSPSSPPPTASTSPTGSTGCPAGRSPSPSSRTCSSRCSTRRCAAEPGAPVRADHRRAARLPVVQRPPGPDLHRRFGRAGAGRDAGRHRADHRPDPRPAADRHHLRGRDDVGHPPGRLLQADRRPAAVPDEPDPPPLRAGRLGRGEDHDPVLDRRRSSPRCSA